MKIGLLDIEVAPNTVHVFGLYNQNISYKKVLDSSYVLCFAWKWLGKNGVEFKSIYHHSEEEMLQRVWHLLDQCDAVIHYYGSKFDIPVLQKEFLQHNMEPPSPYHQIDLFKVVRKEFKFPSKSLDYVSKALGVGGKVQHDGYDLWLGCMNGDKKSWAKMKKYNCLTPDHRVLHDDLVWRSLWETKEGDEILGFDEDGPQRMYRKTRVENIHYEEADVYEVSMSSGKKFRTTKDHGWLTARLRSSKGQSGCLRNYQWKTTEELVENKDCVPTVSDTWEEDLSKRAGWLAGFLDGEGCVYNGPNRNGGVSISFTQKEGAELYKALSILDTMNIDYKVYEGEYGTGDCVVRKVDIRGSVNKRLRALGVLRPERLIEGVSFDRSGRLEARLGYDTIESVEYKGRDIVAVMKTSTRTFIADGYPMHNCQDVALMEPLYYKLLPWIKTHPNHALYIDTERPVCTNCGSESLQSRGTVKSKTQVYRRWVCNDCSTWQRSRQNSTTNKEHVLTQA